MQSVEEQMKSQQILTFYDIVYALKTHPEWLEEIRKIILTTELIELPKKLDELLANFKELNSRVIRVEEKVDTLEKDVGTLKTDVEILKTDVGTLKTDVEILKTDVETLKADVEILKADVATIKKDIAYLKGDFGRFKGKDFERTVRERYYAYFGRILRKVKLLPFEEILPILDEAEEKGLIPEKQREEILKLDLLVKGEIKSTKKPVVLAVEVSFSLHKDDLTRALERALTLGKLLNEEVIPTVVSTKIRKDLEKFAEGSGILLLKVSYE